MFDFIRTIIFFFLNIVCRIVCGKDIYGVMEYAEEHPSVTEGFDNTADQNSGIDWDDEGCMGKFSNTPKPNIFD